MRSAGSLSVQLTALGPFPLSFVIGLLPVFSCPVTRNKRFLILLLEQGVSRNTPQVIECLESCLRHCLQLHGRCSPRHRVQSTAHRQSYSQQLNRSTPGVRARRSKLVRGRTLPRQSVCRKQTTLCPKVSHTLSGFQTTVSLVIGNRSLYKIEEIIEEVSNMGPNASASVSEQINHLEKCFRVGNKRFDPKYFRGSKCFTRFAMFVQLTAHDPQRFKF